MRTWLLLFTALCTVGCRGGDGPTPEMTEGAKRATAPTGPKAQTPAAKPKVGPAAKPKEGPAAKPKEGPAAKPDGPRAAPTGASAPSAATGSKTSAGPPPSDRVFMLDLDGDGFDELLGSDDNALWAMSLADGRLLWRTEGDGVVHRCVVGDFGHGRGLYVARGIGRGHLRAPLALQSVDVATGAAKTLWQRTGERAEPAHLSITDVDNDGVKELAFAHYISKYMVQTRHLEATGAAIDGQPLRMASSRAYGDADGDGHREEVIGRVYGDAKGVVGDLRMITAKGETVMIPSDKGVRAVMVAPRGDGKGTSLYFADGWVSNYGKQAKAQLKQAIWAGGNPVITTIGTSDDEFTFFDLTEVDLDGDGAPEIVARGNKHVSLFRYDGKAWQRRSLAEIRPVLNTAMGKTKAGWKLAVPDRRQTRVVAVSPH